ncbi:MAG: peptidylprolyl isomerase [Planctomycetota bacterium]|jgi:peptidyl-prolyl cis-trans isomerase B (cyclophilin B)
MNRLSSRGAGVRVAACLAACLLAGCAGTAADGRAAPSADRGQADASVAESVDPRADARAAGVAEGAVQGAAGAYTEATAAAGAAQPAAADPAAAADAAAGAREADVAAESEAETDRIAGSAGGAAAIEGGPSAALADDEGGPQDGPPPMPTAADIERFRSLVAELETSQGTIVFGFLPDAAPYTVQNFVVLAGSGFYDGTLFHRIIPRFVAQGGDPDGTGHGGPGYMIKGEFSDVKHERGVVSMARKTHPDTAGSQFFICLADAPHLDGSYAAFGRVLSGFEALERIEAAGSKGGTPSEPITLTRVVIRERTHTDTPTASHDT